MAYLSKKSNISSVLGTDFSTKDSLPRLKLKIESKTNDEEVTYQNPT